MKAAIDERGVMTIKAETPLEAYALRKWSTDAQVFFLDTKLNETGFVRGSMLIIDGNLEPAQ